MNYRVFSLLVSIIILSHLLLGRIDEIQNQNNMLQGNGQVQSSQKPVKEIKEDIVKYIENFESDLDIDDELDYDLDIQYKYRDDDLKIDVPQLSGPNNNLDQETIENATLYKFDEQTKSNIFYSEPSASQGIRTIKPDMYQPQKNEKIINGGYIDKKTHLKPFDDADCGYAAL